MFRHKQSSIQQDLLDRRLFVSKLLVFYISPFKHNILGIPAIEYKGGSAPPLYWRGQSQVFGQRFAQSKDTASGPPSLAGAVPWCPRAPATLGPPKGPLSFRRGFLLYSFLWPPLTPLKKLPSTDKDEKEN